MSTVMTNVPIPPHPLQTVPLNTNHPPTTPSHRSPSYNSMLHRNAVPAVPPPTYPPTQPTLTHSLQQNNPNNTSGYTRNYITVYTDQTEAEAPRTASSPPNFPSNTVMEKLVFNYWFCHFEASALFHYVGFV
jgi:hypothetical protein